MSSKLESGKSMQSEPGLSPEERRLLDTPLPYDLSPSEAAETWGRYQVELKKLLIRMGTEHPKFDAITRLVSIGSVSGAKTKIALIPKLVGGSAIQVVKQQGVRNLVPMVLGIWSLQELSAAAGYRTFCFPELVRGLAKTNKMKNRSVQRMVDTFEFLITMMQCPLNSRRVHEQLKRTNHLHALLKMAGSGNQDARDLFRYIALNMFFIGPSMRPDLTPQERHALCGLTVLVAKRMGHVIEASVNQLEAFIREYEDSNMFDRSDQGDLRKEAVAIAQASKAALDLIPTISPERIHGYVPCKVKQILQIE